MGSSGLNRRKAEYIYEKEGLQIRGLQGKDVRKTC